LRSPQKNRRTLTCWRLTRWRLICWRPSLHLHPRLHLHLYLSLSLDLLSSMLLVVMARMRDPTT
jgi:hypothetical protein